MGWLDAVKKPQTAAAAPATPAMPVVNADDGWSPSYDTGSSTPSTTVSTRSSAPLTPHQQQPPTPTAPGGYSDPWQTSSATPTSSAPAATTTNPREPWQKSWQDLAAAGNVAADDKRARDVYSKLQAAGHQVKWQGNTLIVDGRPYTVGQPLDLPDRPQMAAAAATPTAPGPILQGYDSTKWNDLSHNTPKYDIGRILSKYPQTPAGLQQARAELEATGLISEFLGSDKFRLANGIEGGGHVIDVGQNFNDADPSNDAFWWGDMDAPSTPQAAPGLQAPGGMTLGGIDLTSLFGSRSPSMIDGGGADFGVRGSWQPSFDSYRPGDVGFDDIPNFTPESLQGQISNPALDAYMADLLRNPSTMDAHTVDTMKAKMKDTLAEQAKLEEQDALGWANSMGISDSPWFASERNAAKRSRDQAIASGSQDIDIEAAKTRQADRLAAGSLATSYQGQRGQQILDTVNAGLQRSVATGNRMALRESIAQAAAASGQSAQKLMADWILANAGLDLDYQKLSSQNSQYLLDLMYRMASLQQNDRQFGAQFNQNENHWLYENQV